MAEYIDYIYVHIFIRSSVSAHLVCSHVLGTVSSAAVNVGCICILSGHVFLQIHAQAWGCKFIW